MLRLSDINAHDMIERRSESSKVIIYDKLPSYYTTRDKWPSRTMLSCLFCSRKIDSFPIPIITIINENKWGTYGQYCGFSCAKEYIMYVMDDDINNMNNIRRDELIILLGRLSKEFNINLNKVERPKKINTMICYGGECDPYEWGIHLQ